MKLKPMTAASTSNSWKFEAEPTVQQSVQPWAAELNKRVKAIASIQLSIWYLISSCQLCLFSVSSTSSPTSRLCTLLVDFVLCGSCFLPWNCTWWRHFKEACLPFWCSANAKFIQNQQFITFNTWTSGGSKELSCSKRFCTGCHTWKPGTARSLTLGFRDDKSWVASQCNILRWQGLSTSWISWQILVAWRVGVFSCLLHNKRLNYTNMIWYDMKCEIWNIDIWYMTHHMIWYDIK